MRADRRELGEQRAGEEHHVVPVVVRDCDEEGLPEQKAEAGRLNPREHKEGCSRPAP